MKKRTVRLLIAAAALIVLLIVAKKAGWIGKEATTTVTVEPVVLRTIVETVAAPGIVQPETDVKISADISGEIIALNVKEGDRVKRGDLLVRIKPDELQRAVERSEAALNSSRANLANARAAEAQSRAAFQREQAAWKRAQGLYQQQTISTADYEAAQSAYEVAEAQLEAARQSVIAAQFNVQSAQATLNESRDALRRTHIYAPMDGTITQLAVELGERVVGTAQMAGTEMMRVSNLQAMEVEADVNERDIVKVKEGDSAEVEIAAYRDRKFKGVVTSISNSVPAQAGAAQTQSVTNFKVKIRVTEGQGILKPGMNANVDIITKVARDVPAVKTGAVTLRNSLGDTARRVEVVFLYEDGQAIQREIKTGVQDFDYYQVLEGLKQGEQVITGPYGLVSTTLRNQQKVTVAEKRKK